MLALGLYQVQVQGTTTALSDHTSGTGSATAIYWHHTSGNTMRSSAPAVMVDRLRRHYPTYRCIVFAATEAAGAILPSEKSGGRKPSAFFRNARGCMLLPQKHATLSVTTRNPVPIRRSGLN